MTDQYEPQRLFESPEAPPELRVLLVRAHEDLPSLAEKALLIKAATGWGTDLARTTQASSARWATRMARHATKLWTIAAVGVGIGIGVGVGAGIFYKTGGLPRHAAQVPQLQAPALQPRPSAEDRNPSSEEEGRLGPAAEPHAGPGLPAGRAPAHDLHGGLVARPTPRSHAHRAPSIPLDAKARSGEPAGASVPSAGVSGNSLGDRSQSPGPEATPLDSPAKTVEATLDSRANPPAREDARVTLKAPEEARLLRSARESLDGSPERTLSLTDEHLQRYPHGLLDQERETLAIQALMKLGRSDEARTRARTFQRAYPGSPYRARIEHALARSAGASARP